MKTGTLATLSGAFILILAGCGDKAEADYNRCVKLHGEKKYQEAKTACQAAVDKDSNSRYGTLAKQNLDNLELVIKAQGGGSAAKPQ